MSWRSNQAQRPTIFGFSVDNFVNRGARGTGCSNGRLVGLAATDGISFDSSSAITAKSFDTSDVPSRVDSQQLFLSRGDNLSERAVLKQLLFVEFRSNAAKSCGRFGMPAGVVFEKNRVGVKDGHYCGP